MDLTIKAKFLCKKEGVYSNYVFQDVNNMQYIMCTVLPNWEIPIMKIDDIGFLTFEHAQRGETYLDKNLQEHQYKYTKFYFKDFIKELPNLENIIL
jgi:hypothetical protein